MNGRRNEVADDLIRALRHAGVAKALLANGIEPLAYLVNNPDDTIGLKMNARDVCQALLFELPKLPGQAFKLDAVEFLLGYEPVAISALPQADVERLRTWQGLLSTLFQWVTEKRRFENAVEQGLEDKLVEVQAALATLLADLATLLTPLVALWTSVPRQEGP